MARVLPRYLRGAVRRLVPSIPELGCARDNENDMGQSQNSGPPRLEALQSSRLPCFSCSGPMPSPSATRKWNSVVSFEEEFHGNLGKSDLLNLLSLPFSFSDVE